MNNIIGSPCPKCGGRKAYAPNIYLSYPPQQDWICTKCGEEGCDIGQFMLIDEYTHLKQQKEGQKSK